jgi:hypothetical protein
VDRFSASRAGQIQCTDLVTAQVGSFSFLCIGPSQPRAVVDFLKKKRS